MGKKLSTKPIDGKKLVEDAKTEVKNEKETNMKTPNNTVKTILTVVITLVAVASLVGMFYAGTQFQDSINHNTVSQVKELATTIQTSK